MTAIEIVEDDVAVAASLQALLGSWGYRAVMYATGEDFLAAEHEGTACILLDVRLPGHDGLSVLREFRQSNKHTPVIVMTGHGDVDMAVEAMRRGAQDFIEKPFDDEDLVRRIETAVARALPDLECRERLDRLTPREMDVLNEVVAGHANKVIAYRLDISPKTVELHRSRIMQKTGSKNLPQLIRIALRAGIEAEDGA